MIDSLLACATCANNFVSDDNAAGYAILFMLAVLLPILGGIGFLSGWFIVMVAALKPVR